MIAVDRPPPTITIPSPAGAGALIVLAVCEPYNGKLLPLACAKRFAAANGGPVADGIPSGIKRSRCRGCPDGAARAAAVGPEALRPKSKRKPPQQ